MRFFLGTDRTHWLRMTNVPLFISRRWLAKRRSLPLALGPWALDSGAFTELKDFGRWTIKPQQYVEEVRRWMERPGKLQWASIMDWMCEPAVIEGGKWGKETFVGTGLSTREHQKRTVDSYLALRDLAPEVPWLPVIQGFAHDEYWQCVEDYRAANVDLAALPLVGLGSVCRRQQTGLVEDLVRELASEGIKLHGFGLKIDGVGRCSRHLVSSDSMAWSYGARHRDPLPGCLHRKCNHCLRYALLWREKVLKAAVGGPQLRLF